MKKPLYAIDWLDDTSVEQVRVALAERTVYKDDGGTIKMVPTHIATVFLTERYAFKFKRPVDVGFADFRTLRRRRHFCNEELRLNRRLARDVYLTVVPLWATNGGYSFSQGQMIVDYAVVMKRLPREAMLDFRIDHADVLPEEIDRLADFIARFHMRARSPSRAAHYGRLAIWRVNWEENFAQAEPTVDATIGREGLEVIQHAVWGFMERSGDLIDARAEEGFVRSGHGDLRCEHICLGSKIRIIDCIEFNERFRYGDVANDLAFLIMDLAAARRPDLARALLTRYMERTGDRGMAPLMPFYACYRAFVRGKVAGLTMQEPGLPKWARDEAVRQSRRFLELALAFSRQLAPPVMLMVVGLMGTGKSHLSEALGARIGAQVLASDRTRKELAARVMAQTDPADASQAAWGNGLYTPEWNWKTYDALLEQARQELEAHRSVIVDAAFSRRVDRQRAFALARGMGAEPFLVECRAPQRVAIDRLTEREQTGRSISDGRAALYPDQKRAFEPIDEIPPAHHLILRTDRPVDELVEQVLVGCEIPFPDPIFA